MGMKRRNAALLLTEVYVMQVTNLEQDAIDGTISKASPACLFCLLLIQFRNRCRSEKESDTLRLSVPWALFFQIVGHSLACISREIEGSLRSVLAFHRNYTRPTGGT